MVDESVQFQARFHERQKVERYRDGFRPGGKHAQTHLNEQDALREVLAHVGRVDVAMDLPAGPGRLTSVLAECADKVVLADSSDVCLEVARQDNPDLAAEYVVTTAEDIRLPDGAVDLIFCHRLLNHIDHPDLRARIFVELARVSRRYVIISCNTKRLRSWVRWRLKRLVGLADRASRPVTLPQFFAEVAAAGLNLTAKATLCEDPLALLCLFEKTTKADTPA